MAFVPSFPFHHIDSVLKFSEVYFNAPGQKVFDVVLNNDHSIVSDLDIYSRVGHGVAHDEVIPFTIGDGMLKVQVRNATEIHSAVLGLCL